MLLPALVLALYVSIGNPLIMMFIMGALGYAPALLFCGCLDSASERV